MQRAAERYEADREEVFNLLQKHKRICAEDGAPITFALMGGDESHIQPDELEYDRVESALMCYVSPAP